MNYYKAVCFVVIVFLTGVKGFSWKSCGNSTDPIKVVNLSGHINNSRVLYLDGVGKVGINLTSPLQVSLQIWKKFFWGWTLIPCVENFGSCTYDDLCNMSPYSNEKCPTEFVTNNLPCACPILEGRYLAKGFPINLNILPDWIETGTYRLKINLFKNKEKIFCLMVSETLKKQKIQK